MENDRGGAVAGAISERITKLENRLKLVENVAKGLTKEQAVSGALEDVASDVYDYFHPLEQGDIEEEVY